MKNNSYFSTPPSSSSSPPNPSSPRPNSSHHHHPYASSHYVLNNETNEILSKINLSENGDTVAVVSLHGDGESQMASIPSLIANVVPISPKSSLSSPTSPKSTSKKDGGNNSSSSFQQSPFSLPMPQDESASSSKKKSKKYMVLRSKQLTRWIESLEISQTEITRLKKGKFNFTIPDLESFDLIFFFKKQTNTSIFEDMRGGVLLCKLIERLNPGAKILGINKKPMSLHQATGNIDKAYCYLFKRGISVKVNLRIRRN